MTKNGKYHGEKPVIGVLNNMLSSRTSWATSADRGSRDDAYRPADSTHPSPASTRRAASCTLAGGRNPQGIDTINQFLDVMDVHGIADRTNAVAAALTVPFRHHFPGGKPFVLVTASKSHAGKGTLIEFIRGKTAKAEISYEDKDWPMQRNLHEQLLQKPEIGVINFDNVQDGQFGPGEIIRTGFLESFITNSEIVLSSATSRSKPLRTANKFVVLLNTNEGSLSIDLLNRSLPIRLEPKGDLTERISRAKAVLGGDVKHEWLPASREDRNRTVGNDRPMAQGRQAAGQDGEAPDGAVGRYHRRHLEGQRLQGLPGELLDHQGGADPIPESLASWPSMPGKSFSERATSPRSPLNRDSPRLFAWSRFGK